MIGLRGQCSWCASSKNPRRPDRDGDDIRNNDDGGDDDDADTNSMTPHIPAIVMGVGQWKDLSTRCGWINWSWNCIQTTKQLGEKGGLCPVSKLLCIILAEENMDGFVVPYFRTGRTLGISDLRCSSKQALEAWYISYLRFRRFETIFVNKTYNEELRRRVLSFWPTKQNGFFV